MSLTKDSPNYLHHRKNFLEESPDYEKALHWLHHWRESCLRGELNWEEAWHFQRKVMYYLEKMLDYDNPVNWQNYLRQNGFYDLD